MNKNTRFRLAALVIIAAALLAGLVLARGTRGVLSAHYRVQTAEGRRAYLHALGWEIDPQSEEQHSLTVPEPLDETLTRYNELQLQQGFDLRLWTGKPVTVVSYTVTNADEPTVVTLWISGTVVIAGDVHTTALNGEMRGIVSD